MRMTSACANKMLRKLNEDKEFWRGKESEECTYVASLDEEPVIPDYCFGEVAQIIADIDKKILIIKHAINLANINNVIAVDDREMSIDEILITMAQLNKRKDVLDMMRKQQPKKRVAADFYASRKASPEYKYINYDLDEVKEAYERIDSDISAMQMALDKYNQTVEFDVNI